MRGIYLIFLGILLLGCDVTSTKPEGFEYFVYERDTARCFRVVETESQLLYKGVECESIPSDAKVQYVDRWEEEASDEED